MKYAPIFLLFCVSNAFGQTISKSSLSALGGTYTNTQNNLTLSYNVGEVTIGTLTSGGIQLGSGYFNSFDLDALSVEELYEFGKISVYPNPTSGQISIEFKVAELTEASLGVYDVNGTLKVDILNEKLPDVIIVLA